MWSSKMSEKERRKLNEYATLYVDKFLFPFVICARENSIVTILKAFEKRMQNCEEIETQVGIDEVKKIAFRRLCDIIVENPSKY